MMLDWKIDHNQDEGNKMKTVDVASLREKGEKLIAAAHDFWLERQKFGRCAVVWFEADDPEGHFVLFTRGEYRDQIMKNIEPVMEELNLLPVDEPFTRKE